MIGIGGSGLSAIARLLLERGYLVSGSDRADSLILSDLRSMGADIIIGHDAKNVAGVDVVVRSSAIPDENPEVTAAVKFGVPVLKRAEFLGKLMTGKTGIAVAGTHGKTTTTSMLAWVLTALEQDPSYIVGGVVSNLGVNAHSGKGDCFVIEADEYDGMFLGLKPSLEVITNVEHDHPDCYPTADQFQSAFEQFTDLLPPNGTLIACAQDAGAKKVIAHAQTMNKNIETYAIENFTGQEGDMEIHSKASNLVSNNKGGFSFDAEIKDQSSHVDLQVPGRHNVLNGMACMTTIAILKLPLDKAARALSDFQGVERRFEIRGELEGMTFIDDYAHHPTEIRATLAAARSRYPGRRLWVVWQPHTYSRTQLLQSQFSYAFNDADRVIVTEIYAARESKQDFSARKIVEIMAHPAVKFIPQLGEASNYLISHMRAGDVLLVLSAGDANQITQWVMDYFRNNEVNDV